MNFFFTKLLFITTYVFLVVYVMPKLSPLTAINFLLALAVVFFLDTFLTIVLIVFMTSILTISTSPVMSLFKNMFSLTRILSFNHPMTLCSLFLSPISIFLLPLLIPPLPLLHPSPPPASLIYSRPKTSC